MHNAPITPYRKRSRRGFTLVEVVVASVLLAAGMAGIYRVITMSMQVRKQAHEYFIATNIANNRIEHAKNLFFTELSSLNEQNVLVNELGAADPDGRYQRTSVVTQNPNNDNPHITKLVVSVRVPHPFRRGQFSSEPTSVSTYLTDYKRE